MTHSPPLQITYFGHATVLIEMDGLRLLTDPLLRSRLLHLKRAGPIPDLDRFSPIDAILISHLHRDHLDLPSLVRFEKKVRLIVPAGAGDYLRKRGFKNVDEMTLGETRIINSVHIHSTRARHEGFRIPFGPRAAALGYLIQGSTSVYFAGDTDLFPEMADLAGKIDVALLPVWGWGPTLGPGHMDPFRAAQSLQLLQPRLAIPIHWGTYYPVGFNLLEPGLLREPPLAFRRHAGGLTPNINVRIIQPGESCSFPQE